MSPYRGYIVLAVQLFTSTSVLSGLAAPPRCRCTPPDPCWSAVPWISLNASIGGRLAVTRDPLEPCLVDLTSLACSQVLNATDNEFAVSSVPDGFLRTGLFGTWNLSSVQSSYAVLAESEADVSAAVAFATQYNLRVTVKGTGHGAYATPLST